MTNRKLRKKGAQLIEDEIFTIQTELENLEFDIKSVNFKDLKVLSYDRIKSIRTNLQWIRQYIKHTNQMLATVGEIHWGDQSFSEEGEQTVLLNTSTVYQLQKYDNP